MTERRLRTTYLVAMLVCLVVPIAMSAFRIWQPASIVVGLALAFFLSRALSVVNRDIAQQQQDELMRPGPDTSRTIYVQLIDERGALLPKEEQERRMAAAYRQAGPRDVVVPVKKKT